MRVLSLVVAHRQLTDQNKKLEDEIAKLTNDHKEEVEMLLRECNDAVKRAGEKVAMPATSESGEF